MHRDDDSTFLFEPLPDTRQALPIGNRSLDLGPKSANLTGFRGGFFPAPLREAEPGFGDPLLLGLCVIFVLGHSADILRRIPTSFNTLRQLSDASTSFDVFRHPAARIARPASGSQAKNIGSGT